MARKYSEKEIRLLEKAAVQLAIIDDALTSLGIPMTVDIDGKSENGTHDRFRSFVSSPRIIRRSMGFWHEVKKLFRWRVWFYRDKNHVGPFIGGMTSLSGDALVWIGKTCIAISNREHQLKAL